MKVITFALDPISLLRDFPQLISPSLSYICSFPLLPGSFSFIVLWICACYNPNEQSLFLIPCSHPATILSFSLPSTLRLVARVVCLHSLYLAIFLVLHTYIHVFASVSSLELGLPWIFVLPNAETFWDPRLLENIWLVLWLPWEIVWTLLPVNCCGW